MNQGFGKDFYKKGNSVKRFGPFTEPPDSENWKVAVLIPFPKISSYYPVLVVGAMHSPYECAKTVAPKSLP